jgi:Uma2 family endonuclease
MTAYTIDLHPLIEMTDEQFHQLCRVNPDLKFERNHRGDLVIMSPTGGETGKRNSELNADFVIWNRRTGLGVVCDSSTCFKLPNGANRSPDVAWIRQDRWDALTPEEREKFPPICPDFVLELRSPSDQLTDLHHKMQEYIDNGAQLGLLLNRQDQQLEVYRPGQPVEILQAPQSISCEPVLPGFVLNVQGIW